jgi:flavin reductase (DIM6/NTAB) family NADH-FMN oxidoreductase RutF
VPVLVSAQSSLVCRVADRHDFGTHTIFIGELIGARHRHNARPLTWYDGRYIDISEAPGQNAVE